MRHNNHIAEILPIANSAREKNLRKYGTTIFRNGPRFAKSDAIEEGSFCIEGWAVLFNEPIGLQSGEIVVFERGCFDDHLASRETDFRLAHDETQVVGSTHSGLELYATDAGLAYRMPLNNRQYASAIKRKVESNKQSAISIGISRSTERTETIGKHNVIFIERAELLESSLVGEGCCEQAFAYLIDADDAPPLKDSINSQSFKLESVAHNLRTQYRKKMRKLDALTERIAALQESPVSKPMTTNESNAYHTASIEEMQTDRRAKLRSM